MVSFRIKIANKVLDVNAFNESTMKYCRNFFTDEEPDYLITMTKEELESESSNSPDGKVYGTEEISALYRKVAELFVEEGIIVFHGSSFKIKEHGFIITARSGVGKSTHVKLLSEYLGDKFSYINDDKPLIEAKDNKLTIYSNPWNGKERRGNNTSSPLTAVLFVNRGLSNSYKKLDNKEEVYFKLLTQIYLPRDKAKREKALKIIDIILKSINFYEINVNMDISAAEMTYERIIKNEIK